MICPACGVDSSKVIDSRSADNGESIRRRRECESCGYRFTTYERVEAIPILVKKKTGVTEFFDREKLLRALLTAAGKRRIAADELYALIDDIENTLRSSRDYQVTSDTIGEMVLVRLKDLDKVAYVRFASVYRQFDDLDEFVSELNSIS
jgi:transcriptional repressor NrdR